MLFAPKVAVEWQAIRTSTQRIFRIRKPSPNRSLIIRSLYWSLIALSAAAHARRGSRFPPRRPSALQVRPESPLREGIRNGLCLLRKRAENVNVLHFAFFIDDDPHRNRVESAFGKDWIFSLDYVFVASVVLDAHRCFAAARP